MSLISQCHTKYYVCPIEDCGKIFHDKGAFRKHQLTHGEKLVSPIHNVKYTFSTHAKTVEKNS